MTHTIGIKCKACDASLGSDDYDGELCTTCLEAVFETNKDLYDELDENARLIHERMQANEVAR